MRVVKYLFELLSSEVLESPSLQIFESWLDNTLSNLILDAPAFIEGFNWVVL